MPSFTPSRRDFIRDAVLGGAAFSTLGRRAWSSTVKPTNSKTVVVTFGGGARDEETFAPEGQENIPHLISELIPQATFCTQVVNQGILGHYVATASLATGVYETFDNFAAVSPQNPTIFEYFRHDLHRPATDAWVIAPSNGFNGIGESNGSRIASGLGAPVILPKLLLAEAQKHSGSKAFGMDHLLQDSYENPLFASPVNKTDVPLSKLADTLNVSVDDFLEHAQKLSSADELSVFVMKRLMKQFSPSLLWITLHDMDVAHSGAFSLYIDAIKRTDRLCAEIWNTIQGDGNYKDKTNLLILPDFGRDSDFEASGNGFQHHRTGDALSRTTWLMALGPNVRQNVTVDRPMESIDLAPTLGALMGFHASGSHGKPIVELL